MFRAQLYSGGRGTARVGSEKMGAVVPVGERRSDKLRSRSRRRSGRVGSVTTAGCSHSRQDAAGGTRAPRRRRQVDDDRLALDSTLLVVVADGEARDSVVILAAGDDARLRRRVDRDSARGEFRDVATL